VSTHWSLIWWIIEHRLSGVKKLPTYRGVYFVAPIAEPSIFLWATITPPTILWIVSHLMNNIILQIIHPLAWWGARSLCHNSGINSAALNTEPSYIQSSSELPWQKCDMSAFFNRVKLSHTRGVYFEFNSVTSHLLQSGVCFVSSIDVEPSFILSHEPPKVFTYQQRLLCCLHHWVSIFIGEYRNRCLRGVKLLSC